MNQTIIDWDELTKSLYFLEKVLPKAKESIGAFDGGIEIQ